MAGPSNETEAEMLERRKVEALERIADLLERTLTTISDMTHESGASLCVTIYTQPNDEPVIISK